MSAALLPFPAWMRDASCGPVGMPDEWFPHPGQNPLMAKRVCARCPVRAKCLEYAIDGADRGADSHPEGVWGGLSVREREELMRQRRREAAA